MVATAIETGYVKQAARGIRSAWESGHIVDGDTGSHYISASLAADRAGLTVPQLRKVVEKYGRTLRAVCGVGIIYERSETSRPARVCLSGVPNTLKV